MFPDSQFAIKSTFCQSADNIRTSIRPERATQNPTPVNTRLTGCIPAVLLRNCQRGGNSMASEGFKQQQHHVTCRKFM